MRNHDIGDEILEALWVRDHESPARLGKLAADIQEGMAEAYRRLLAEGKVTESGGQYALTDKGGRIAEQLVRRHRLAERLFVDVLGFSGLEANRVACGFEHFLEDDATDAVCTFLGHPPTCPHNKSIPRGECCREQARVTPFITSLYDFHVGRKGRVAFVKTEDHRMSDRLISLGIYPGQVIHLHQKIPSFLIQVDHTEIGLEAAVARTIFVRPIE